MENEENRGLINKNAYEDQLIPFVNLVLDLSLYLLSLSHSWTLRAFLEHFSIGSRKVEEGQRRKAEAKVKQGRTISSGYNGIT